MPALPLSLELREANRWGWVGQIIRGVPCLSWGTDLFSGMWWSKVSIPSQVSISPGLPIHWGEGEQGGAMGMELQGSRERNLWPSEQGLKRRRNQEMQGGRGGLGGNGVRRSSMARSPGEAQLDLFAPGPEGHISAQIFQGGEGSSASFCLRPAARRHTPVQTLHPQRSS